MKNKIEDLRNHLFATIEGLLDNDKPLDIQRANAVANVAGRLIDSAKVEVEFLKATDRIKGSGFITPEPEQRPAIEGNVARIGNR
jgi:hypothetical protein